MINTYYYFNNNSDKNNNHEIHTENCSYLPTVLNRTYIGYFSNCKDAINEAKKNAPNKNFDGCRWCCNPCHKG